MSGQYFAKTANLLRLRSFIYSVKFVSIVFVGTDKFLIIYFMYLIPYRGKYHKIIFSVVFWFTNSVGILIILIELIRVSERVVLGGSICCLALSKSKFKLTGK